jgi:hypothetical protein
MIICRSLAALTVIALCVRWQSGSYREYGDRLEACPANDTPAAFSRRNRSFLTRRCRGRRLWRR